MSCLEVNRFGRVTGEVVQKGTQARVAVVVVVAAGRVVVRVGDVVTADERVKVGVRRFQDTPLTWTDATRHKLKVVVNPRHAPTPPKPNGLGTPHRQRRGIGKRQQRDAVEGTFRVVGRHVPRVENGKGIRSTWVGWVCLTQDDEAVGRRALRAYDGLYKDVRYLA